MAETPEGAAAFSDDEIDRLVNEVEGKDESPATDTEEPSGTASDSDEAQDEDNPTGETEVQGLGDEDEAETAQPKAEAPVPAPAATERPFQFKAARGVHSLPSAVELPDGSVKIGKDGVGQLRQRLGSQVELEREWKTQRRDYERQLKTAQEARTDKDIESDQVLGLFKDVRQMSPEERWEWANEFDSKAPKLELAIEKAKLDRERQELDRARNPELSEEETREQVGEILTSEVRSTFQRLMAAPEAKYLTQDDKLKLWDKWSRKADRLVAVADRDDPQNDLKKGDRFFDDSDIVDDFIDRVTVRQEAGKTLSAAQRNAAMNADQRTARGIPPVARGSQPVNTPGSKKPKKLKGKAFKNAFLRGELDTAE